MTLPDPRSILVLLIALSTTVYGSPSPWFVLACQLIVLMLLASAGPSIGEGVTWRLLGGYVAMFALCFAAVRVIPMVWHSSASALFTVILEWMLRFAVVAGAGAYAILVIRPATLSAALSASRVPQSLTIPLSVALRIAPVIRAEASAIREAMRLRRLSMASPRAAEYFTIPLLSTVVRCGDDLASAALVRGLGATGSPTTINVLRFRAIDAVFIAVSVGLLAWRLLG